MECSLCVEIDHALIFLPFLSRTNDKSNIYTSIIIPRCHHFKPWPNAVMRSPPPLLIAQSVLENHLLSYSLKGRYL